MILTPNRCPVAFFSPSEAQSSVGTRASIHTASAERAAAGSAATAPIAPALPAAAPVVEPYSAGSDHEVDTALNAALVARVLAEYREMPGLLLTLPQASRLWNTDLTAIRVVLELLVARGSLRQAGATYLRADSGRRCAS